MAWKKVNLEEVTDIIMGQSPKGDTYNEKGLGMPFFQGKAEFGKRNPIVKKWTTDPKKIAPENSILMSVRAPVGDINISNQECCIGRGLCSILPKVAIIDLGYLTHYIGTQKNYFENISTGSTFKAINAKQIRSLEIPLPPMEVQVKIASALDRAQDLIDSRKAQIEKYDELLQSVFMEMFGDPVTNPRGWEVKKLKELSTKILSGNTPKGGSNVYVKDGITFFRSQNVWRNRLDLDDIVYIDEETHKKMQKSSLKNRDILMTKTGRINTENSSLGRAAMFLGKDNTGNINGHVYLIRLNKKIIDKFVLYIITTNEYRDYIRSVCVGGIDKRQINKSHLEEFPIIYPPKHQQEKFVSIVEKVEAEKKVLEKSLIQIEENFNSIMQRAFRGEMF